MDITIKSIKINKALSEETCCFSASLYVNGTRVGSVGNRGSGGENEYDGVPHGTLKRLREWCNALPPIQPQDNAPGWVKKLGPLPMDLDAYIGNLLDEWDIAQWLKRTVRKSTVFRLEGDDSGTFRSVNARGPEVLAQLQKKYGPKLIEVH